MTIRHFRIFVAVATTESITKAAELLSLTQPTVSIAIKELEKHYGMRFFDRINQRLKITEAGRSMLNYATHLIQLYDDIEQIFQPTNFKGILRVGTSIAVGVYYMPSLTQIFYKSFPNIRIQVRVSTTRVIEKLLLDNQVDIAIVSGMIHSPFIRLMPLFEEKHIAVCAPSYPIAQKEITLQEFVKQPLLFREKSSRVFKAFQAAVEQAGYTADLAWESCSLEALLEATRCGLGVAIVPEKLVKKDLSFNRLAYVHISNFSMQNTIYLAYHKNKFISPAMKHFIEMVKEQAQYHLYP